MAPAAGAEAAIPASPIDGEAAGARPVFRFTIKPPAERAPRVLIEVSRDRWKTVERSWDSGASQRGWQIRSDAGALTGAFRCPEALAEGAWEWRARIVQGLAAVEGGRPAAFKVDATPPAEAENLRLDRRRDGSVALSWDPVSTDIEGRPESVDHYVIYRYEVRGTFPQAAPARIGRSRIPSFLDRTASREIRAEATPRASESGGKGTGTESWPERRTTAGLPEHPAVSHVVYYYKVAAVDAAGNELGVRELGAGEEAGETPARLPRPK